MAIIRIQTDPAYHRLSLSIKKSTYLSSQKHLARILSDK